MMSKGVIILLLLQLCGNILIVSSLKCDSTVKIESKEVFNYLGNVTFIAPGTVEGNWTLKMTTNAPFSFIGGWEVEVTSEPKKGTAIFQSLNDTNVKKGEIISFRFRIYYEPSSKRVPKVKTIKWDKWTICEGNNLNSGFSNESNSENINAFKRRVKHYRK